MRRATPHPGAYGTLWRPGGEVRVQILQIELEQLHGVGSGLVAGQHAVDCVEEQLRGVGKVTQNRYLLRLAVDDYLITVFPDTKQMFVAWFTFDAERPAEDIPSVIGEPGHRWLIALGPYAGTTATLTIFVSIGGVFDSSTPAPVTDPEGDGTLTLAPTNGV